MEMSEKTYLSMPFNELLGGINHGAVTLLADSNDIAMVMLAAMKNISKEVPTNSKCKGRESSTIDRPQVHYQSQRLHNVKHQALATEVSEPTWWQQPPKVAKCTQR